MQLRTTPARGLNLFLEPLQQGGTHTCSNAFWRHIQNIDGSLLWRAHPYPNDRAAFFCEVRTPVSYTHLTLPTICSV